MANDDTVARGNGSMKHACAPVKLCRDCLVVYACWLVRYDERHHELWRAGASEGLGEPESVNYVSRDFLSQLK